MSGSPLAGEEAERLVARPYLALVDQVLRRQLLHPLFDGLDVLRHERTIDDEVVEEAFVSRRADAALGAGEELGDGRGQEVRRAMPVERERLRVAIGHNRQPRVGVQGIGEIDQPAIDGGRQRRLREARRHECRDVAGRYCPRARDGWIRRVT